MKKVKELKRNFFVQRKNNSICQVLAYNDIEELLEYTNKKMYTLRSRGDIDTLHKDIGLSDSCFGVFSKHFIEPNIPIYYTKDEWSTDKESLIMKSISSKESEVWNGSLKDARWFLKFDPFFIENSKLVSDALMVLGLDDLSVTYMTDWKIPTDVEFRRCLKIEDENGRFVPPQDYLTSDILLDSCKHFNSTTKCYPIRYVEGEIEIHDTPLKGTPKQIQEQIALLNREEVL